jgi:hypothetical protein
MSDEIELPELFAPQGGWRVRILDLSGANADDENVVEEVTGFPTIMHANAFARAYVRDSVELCRQSGMTAHDVLAAWFAFGEDAHAIEAPTEQTWRSATELDQFAANPSGEIERDWRSLDPRRPENDDEDPELDQPE